jgi:peroxiredoxin
MANNLTGNYEAVLQVSVRQINGLLATLHQNGGEKGKSPSFPHRSMNVAVGGLPKVLSPKIVQFAQWLGSAVQSVRAAGRAEMSYATPLEIGAHYAEKAPPGAVARFNKDLRDLITARDEAAPSGRVRGLADVQISTPAISLVRSEVIVHVYIRAHYHPEGGTPPLPEPIHGEVRISYELAPKTVGGKNVLEVVIPSDDRRVEFFPAPGSGMSQATADSTIAVHVRKAIRERFKPTPVDLPGDFKYFEFKGLGSFGNLLDNHWVDALGTGDEQALVLPVQLSGAPAPPGAIDTVINLFLGTGPSQNDFAIAVSKEYVTAQLAPMLDKLRQYQESFEVELPWPLPNPTYHISVTGVNLQFNVGSIDLVINAKATTRAVGFPDYDPIGITQRLTLALIGQTVTLQASDSDLTITGITGIGSGEANSRARPRIIAQRDKALPAAQAAITKAFETTRTQLIGALVKFDDSASASYTAVEVNPDGIIVRGDINTKWHNDPILVPPGETDGGKSFTALETWVPGGRVDRYRWTWCEAIVFTTSSGATFTIPWECKAQSSGDRPHSFIYPKPVALQGRPLWSPGICLAIEGTQVLPDGRTRGVGGRWGTCGATAREPVVVLDPLTYAIYEILGWPEPPAPDGVLQEGIGGHVNILAAHPLPAGGPGTNTLIYFAGPRAARPLEALDRALAQVRRRDFALTFVVVMPQGAFASRRREVEGRLGLPEESGQQIASRHTDEARPESREGRLPVPFVITEDYVEGWTRAFGVTETPASYLVNARGEFVWKQEGSLDPERLAAALDEHLMASQPRLPLPLRLAVQPGEPALDVTLEDDQRQVLALRRLRGKSVLLLFWQAWSAPCIKELLRLQRLHEAGGERLPVIVAVNGGEGREAIAEVRRQHKLTVTLVPDADQRIAQLYGVACWPTTVSINPDGIVDRIQFGVEHTHRADDRGMQAP